MKDTMVSVNLCNKNVPITKSNLNKCELVNPIKLTKERKQLSYINLAFCGLKPTRRIAITHQIFGNYLLPNLFQSLEEIYGVLGCSRFLCCMV